MRFGERIGALAYRVAAKQRRFADRNLRIARFPHPDTTAQERDRFIRSVFTHFGRMLVDFLRGPLFTPAEMDRLIACEGREHLRAAQEAGRGVIILTAHIGNWELLPRWLAANGNKLTVVARDPHDPALADYIRALRENAGFAVESKGGAARELLTVLKRRETIFLMPDQNSGDLFAPFFGVPAGTVAGPAALALHTGAVILPTYCLLEADYCYRIRILPPLDTRPTGNKAEDTARIMTEANLILESVIHEHPAQWLWLHNRWKSAFEAKNQERAWGDFPDADFAEAQARWQGNGEDAAASAKPG